MNDKINIPFYAKVALISIGFFAFGFAIHLGQDIIIPVVYAILLAILLNPLVSFFMGMRCNRIISISLALLISTILVFGAFYIILSQLTSFSDSLPELKGKFNLLFDNIIQLISSKLNFPEKDVNKWISEIELVII